MATTKKDIVSNSNSISSRSNPTISESQNLDALINSGPYPGPINKHNKLNPKEIETSPYLLDNKNNKSNLLNPYKQTRKTLNDNINKPKTLDSSQQITKTTLNLKKQQNLRMSFERKTPSQITHDILMALYQNKTTGQNKLNEISSCFSNIKPSELSESEFLNLQALKQKFPDKLNLNPDITESLKGVSNGISDIKNLIDTDSNPKNVLHAVNMWALSYSSLVGNTWTENITTALKSINSLYNNTNELNPTVLNNLNSLSKEFSFEFNPEISKTLKTINENKLKTYNDQLKIKSLLDDLITANTISHSKFSIKDSTKFISKPIHSFNKFINNLFNKVVSSLKHFEIPKYSINKDVNQKQEKTISKNDKSLNI